ncbi:MAG: Xaa-Pro peptidase family protein [Phoenicibacter congonensis]|uniref:Xaa-Pro peptidase family protein n=1 Tax=Phoenicibacter congonensis TaxID=1944646 RepID=A0AA43RIW9_9ACTN|nr:Xaa-Pro peptidase family protein [Phoenicibacter congonensis]
MEKHICIPKSDFEARLANLRDEMNKRGLDVMFVYGDEYRKENLRYVSNYWPLFERGGMIFGMSGEPTVLCAPEGEKVCREMSMWENVKLLPDFLCVTVPDEIDYPLATYTSFKNLAAELRAQGKLEKMGIVGMEDMSESLMNKIRAAFDCELVRADDILYKLRLTKSPNELACLREAARIADEGMKAIMQADIIGMTETQACAIAEGKARAEGAEQVTFTVFGSGERSALIIGRPSSAKIIHDGDMIMLALAIQYEGYVATCEAPFAVGNYSEETRRVIDTLIHASAAGLPYLRAGQPMKNFVRAVRDYFREAGLAEYDVYPPLHGIGCAEAESPYPDENTEALFEVGMTCNTDISLFGLPGGSNRIEEGFVITENGAQTLSPFVRSYCEGWIANERN